VEFKRFSIGIHFSPDYCYRKLTLLTATDYTSSAFKYRNRNEIPMTGFSAGADLSFYLKKYFAVSLGVDFSQKGYQTKPIDVVTIANPDSAIGKVKFRYNYNYITIPLKANFIFGKKNVRFLASAGITSAFMIYQRTIFKYMYDDGTKSSKKDLPNYIYNPFNLFLTGSIGVDLLLGKKMELAIEPTYCYGLRQTISAAITEHLWNAGLNIGWHIRF
jgi:hypothetical protein